ncbi:aromatic ring-hydroxylating dioxygenase subunit alpha [Barrientosiimonas humi]|uniref:aromatic ring-hydroxylating oxygenase subunit alpha n=1 Tax=Barrientosiimonas humi TaxID=999931 RepID=UPI00370D75EF
MPRSVMEYPLDRGAPPVDVIPAVLPATAYSDPAQLDAEHTALWATDWIFIGPRAAFPATRGYAPARVGKASVLVTVDEGRLRAFYNVCAHRGCELADSVQEHKAISCPYHAWVYGLDGTLRSARDFSGAGSNHLPPSGPRVTGLTEVRLESWLGLLFVNLSSDAPPLTDRIEPILARWSHVDLSTATHTDTLQYEFDANWKLIVENFLESYHVPFLHQALDQYSPATGRYQIQLGNDINGIGTRPYTGVSHDGRQLPQWRSDQPLDYAEYFQATTNCLLGIMPDHMFAWALQADSPGRTIETLHFFFPSASAADPVFAPHRGETLSRWVTVNDEDHDVVQRMHSGLTNGPLERARLSPVMERNILRFQHFIAERTGS